MATNIVMIVGLPASGKTTYAKNHYGNIENCYIADDFSISPSMHIEQIQNLNPERIVIVDPLLCTASVRNVEEIIKKMLGIEINSFEWVYFENDPISCKNNAKNRVDGRSVAVDIDVLSRRYKIPSNSKILPVFKNVS